MPWDHLKLFMNAVKGEAQGVAAERLPNTPNLASHGPLRINLSRYNDESDIDRIIEVLPVIVARRRRLSPCLDDKRDCLDI